MTSTPEPPLSPDDRERILTSVRLLVDGRIQHAGHQDDQHVTEAARPIADALSGLSPQGVLMLDDLATTLKAMARGIAVKQLIDALVERDRERSK